MANSTLNKKAPAQGMDPDKTGDLSVAAAASSKPHKRSARGSDVAKREKQERRAARKQASASPRGAASRGASSRPESGRRAVAGAQTPPRPGGPPPRHAPPAPPPTHKTKTPAQPPGGGV